jgi:UDP-N-acetylmuramyl pentapeptide phosphotransferase/UDP-N-acetylglucosamine-1-phosphate transferase
MMVMVMVMVIVIVMVVVMPKRISLIEKHSSKNHPHHKHLLESNLRRQNLRHSLHLLWTDS